MKVLVNLLLIFVVSFGGGIAGRLWLQSGSMDAQASTGGTLPTKELEELAEVYRLIKQDYVEEIDGGDLIKRAARGMVASLDPHSSYLDLSEYNQFVEGLTNEEYGGVGTYIGTRDNWIEIISPIYDSPAHRAGINAGDLILKIDGESTQGMKVEDAVKKMRGVVDTVLELDILPTGESVRHVELVRETIVTPSVLSGVVDGYGYLRITRFQNKTMEDLINAINGLYTENDSALKGIMLDLRNNPGGYLLAGVGAAATFLPAGATVVIEKGRHTGKEKVFTANPDHSRDLEHRQLVREVPLVVLVNNGSASASEIVAGALQDHRRGVIIGTRTYGKASVQSLVRLSSSKGQSALRLTTARYYTPLDRNIQARGIEPDIVVARQLSVETEEEGFTIREDDIGGHLENTNTDPENEENDGSADDRPPFVDENDYQYDQALQILKALAVTASR